jgi:magnesium-transporting ATPase (P-type)
MVRISCDSLATDGIVIECTDMKVDESSLTGESVPVTKNAAEKVFMLSGCAVVEGVGRYLVVAVGKHSEWGKIMTELDTERPDTPLQVRSCRSTWYAHEKCLNLFFLSQIKLAGVAETVGKFGLAVSAACFVAQTIIWLAEMGQKVPTGPEFTNFTLNPYFYLHRGRVHKPS